MRGILSAAPGPSAIRLMVGTHLLLMIQAALVLWSAPHVDLPLRILVGMVFAIAAGGLVAAICRRMKIPMAEGEELVGFLDVFALEAGEELK